MKRVAIVCGTGIATSTIVAEKVKTGLKARGVNAEILQCKVIELAGYADTLDLVVSTTFVSGKINVPVISAINLITGINEESILDEIASKLK